MEVPIIRAKVEIGELMDAINLANNLIDKIQEAQRIAGQLNQKIEGLDINLSFCGKQEDQQATASLEFEQ